MFPIQDETRRPARQPIVTMAIIGLNAVVFVFELIGGDAFVNLWSAVPADIVAGRHLLTILTSMFMHASWSHIIGNMVFLWAFGPEIEDAMDPLRYVTFYLAGGVVATLGAGAGRSGLDDPQSRRERGDRRRDGRVPGDLSSRQDPHFGLLRLVRARHVIPAALLIGFWFVIQLLSFGAVTDAQSGGVAYAAHIGGIAFGALTCRLFEDPRRIRDKTGRSIELRPGALAAAGRRRVSARRERKDAATGRVYKAFVGAAAGRALVVALSSSCRSSPLCRPAGARLPARPCRAAGAGSRRSPASRRCRPQQ